MWIAILLTLTAHAETVQDLTPKRTAAVVHETGRVGLSAIHASTPDEEAYTASSVNALRARMAPHRQTLKKGLAQDTWYAASSDNAPPSSELPIDLVIAWAALGDTTFTPTNTPVAHKKALSDDDWVHQREAWSNWRLLTDASGEVQAAVRGYQRVTYGRGSWTTNQDVLVSYDEGVPTQIYRSQTQFGDMTEWLVDLAWTSSGTLASSTVHKLERFSHEDETEAHTYAIRLNG
jgi:hypothetical protein